MFRADLGRLAGAAGSHATCHSCTPGCAWAAHASSLVGVGDAVVSSLRLGATVNQLRERLGSPPVLRPGPLAGGGPRRLVKSRLIFIGLTRPSAPQTEASMPLRWLQLAFIGQA